MKLKLILMMTVALLGFGFMRPIQEIAWAQDEYCAELINYPLEVTWQYSGSNTEYCPANAWTGAGWLSCGSYFSYLYDYYVRLNLTFTIPAGAQHVSYAAASWNGVASGGTWQVGYVSHNLGISYGNSAEATRVAINGLQYPNQRKSISLRLEQRNLTESEADAGFLVDSFYVCWIGGEPFEPPGQDFIKPLRSAHQTHAYANLFIADGSQRPVHAAADGTITRVRDLTPADCVRWGLGERCYLAPNEYWQGGDSDNVQYIVLSASDIDIEYVVYNASGFVYEGLSVTAGCVIGQTTSLNATLAYADEADLIDWFTIEPSVSAMPCFDDNRECIDQDMSFQTFGNVIISNGEYILSAGSSIYTTMALPVDTRVQLRVTARSTAPATLEMQLGTTRRSFNLSMVSSTYTLGYRYFDPDLLDFYSMRITNADSSANIQITDICLAIETIASDYPDHCYFTNYSFDQGIVGWSVAEGVMPGSGELFLPSGQSISQLAELYPDGDDPATYTLEIDIGVWYYNDFSLLRSDTLNTISISYIYPYIEDDPFQIIDTITFGDIASANNNIRITTSFDIENQTDGSFVIAISIDTLDSDVRGGSIRRVCIVPDGDEWFGYENPHPTTPIFSEDCAIPHLPQGGFSADWITWLWGNFSLFFRCDLMQLLNDLYEIARWLQATIVHAFAWTEYYLIPYVAGYFENYSIQLELIVMGIDYTSSAPADWGWE